MFKFLNNKLIKRILAGILLWTIVTGGVTFLIYNDHCNKENPLSIGQSIVIALAGEGIITLCVAGLFLIVWLIMYTFGFD